jgi:hypothetical protein
MKDLFPRDIPNHHQKRGQSKKDSPQSKQSYEALLATAWPFFEGDNPAVAVSKEDDSRDEFGL